MYESVTCGLWQWLLIVILIHLMHLDCPVTWSVLGWNNSVKETGVEWRCEGVSWLSWLSCVSSWNVRIWVSGICYQLAVAGKCSSHLVIVPSSLASPLGLHQFKNHAACPINSLKKSLITTINTIQVGLQTVKAMMIWHFNLMRPKHFSICKAQYWLSLASVD